MYLKSLEMQGFKSFAGKTRLEFHNGVTAIVGPNGSGKSNVGDAVRWVLGEQSAKQLRGGNMADVIFSGTETRKPLGFAMVSITLDNSDRKLNLDADEVMVTRKLYRSGESEYLLNGHACRLKDINELFYDTGIGKEGYSIIGQGQIDKILSGRPDDRRELFDEAAGIVKFKRRKIESQRKLADEQSNLVRVNDILSEVEKQVGPLKKQSEKAEAYLSKRDRLRTSEIMLFQIDGDLTEQQEKNLTDKKQIASGHLADTEKQLEKTRREYDEIEVRLGELDSRIAASREKAQKAVLEKQQQEGQTDVLREQMKAAEQNRQMLENRLASIDKEKEERQTTLDEQKKEREALSASVQQAEKTKDEKDSAAEAIRTEIGTYQSGAEAGKSDMIRLLNDRSTIRERVQRYDTMLEQIGIRRSELNSRMLNMKQQAAEEQETMKKLEIELQSVSEKAAGKQKALDSTNETLASCKKRLTEDNSRLEDLQTQYHRESSRLESLRSIAESYEGYANSIRRVMEQKDRNPGIHGVVADLIRTKKEYETAIETALGGSVQNIVTDNESTSKYLIEYLKRGHFGRATFLPLTAMREEKPFERRDVLSEPGVIDCAENIVTCEPIYKGVVNRLLGRTVVVDTIDHAIAVSRKYHQSIRMVTLTGELLSPGGSMTGGSFKYNNNLLGRKRQIQELEVLVSRLKNDLEHIRTDIEETKKVRNAAREDLSRDTEEMQQLSLKLNAAKINYDNGKKRSDSFQEEYDSLKKERTEIEQQIAEITEKNRLIGDELHDSEKSEADLREKIREMTDKSDRLSEKLRQAQDEQNQAMLDFSNLQQQLTFLDEKIRSQQEEIAKLDGEKESVGQEIQAGDGNSDARKHAIEELRKSAEESAKTAEEASGQVKALEQEKEELNRDHHSFFEERDRLSGEKSDMEQEIFRLDAQLEKVRSTRDDQISGLYEQYGITPDQADAVHFDELPERGALKKDISTLKSEISALGAVNVNAVEEYREMKERYDFLKTQHDDLIKATDELNGIIAQLDEGMRTQFREKFEQIRTEYDRVFRQLFGGGKGDLELVEGEDILESGVIITAQPPGKKLQNMMQLSGGEKALSAIALLFAIQNLKPSPFCLLDEIEAALDDNNVGRFAGYLHKLTKNTQFIVITHRRGTMAEADRLYGITMQEKGVSTLVSVDLIESQLDA
ncbi:MAG: chromosome segregation protein SMC [Eubacteriales bacterium]|jgi:chromosome segregation protein